MAIALPALSITILKIVKISVNNAEQNQFPNVHHAILQFEAPISQTKVYVCQLVIMSLLIVINAAPLSLGRNLQSILHPHLFKRTKTLFQKNNSS